MLNISTHHEPFRYLKTIAHRMPNNLIKITNPQFPRNSSYVLTICSNHLIFFWQKKHINKPWRIFTFLNKLPLSFWLSFWLIFKINSILSGNFAFFKSFLLPRCQHCTKILHWSNTQLSYYPIVTARCPLPKNPSTTRDRLVVSILSGIFGLQFTGKNVLLYDKIL